MWFDVQIATIDQINYPLKCGAKNQDLKLNFDQSNVPTILT